MADDKKEYILNIRISKDVYEKLKEKATENRETLSNLVRNVIDDGLEIFDDVKSELFGQSSTRNGKVKYYSEVILAEASTCSKCKKSLKKGSIAYLAETDRGKKHFICKECR